MAIENTNWLKRTYEITSITKVQRLLSELGINPSSGRTIYGKKNLILSIILNRDFTSVLMKVGNGYTYLTMDRTVLSATRLYNNKLCLPISRRNDILSDM